MRINEIYLKLFSIRPVTWWHKGVRIQLLKVKNNFPVFVM